MVFLTHKECPQHRISENKWPQKCSFEQLCLSSPFIWALIGGRRLPVFLYFISNIKGQNIDFLKVTILIKLFSSLFWWLTVRGVYQNRRIGEPPFVFGKQEKRRNYLNETLKIIIKMLTIKLYFCEYSILLILLNLYSFLLPFLTKFLLWGPKFPL